MKILEHFFNKNNGESKILLDLEPNTCIVYVTSHGIQIQEPFGSQPLTFEQTGPIFQFIQEYLDAISENNLTEQKQSNEQAEQTGTHSANQTTDPSGEVPQSPSKEDSKSSSEAKERGKGQDLGSQLVETG